MLPVERPYGGVVGSNGWGPNSPSGALPGADSWHSLRGTFRIGSWRIRSILHNRLLPDTRAAKCQARSHTDDKGFVDGCRLGLRMIETLDSFGLKRKSGKDNIPLSIEIQDCFTCPFLTSKLGCCQSSRLAERRKTRES